MLLAVTGCYGSKIMRMVKYKNIGREIKIPLVLKGLFEWIYCHQKVSLCMLVLLNSIRFLTPRSK